VLTKPQNQYVVIANKKFLLTAKLVPIYLLNGRLYSTCTNSQCQIIAIKAHRVIACLRFGSLTKRNTEYYVVISNQNCQNCNSYSGNAALLGTFAIDTWLLKWSAQNLIAQQVS
jgi:hypothetical protein